MLTKRQKQVLDFIRTYFKKYEYAPSLEEIQKHLNLSSISTAHFHVRHLQEAKYLSRHENKPRSISLLENEHMVQVPLLGIIAAGQPIEAIENKEYIAVGQSRIPSSGNVFALRVLGDSMIDEGINDGDIILVKQQSTAENGQKVVVLIDNHEATLKKFYKEKNHIRLQPANKQLEPIIIKKDKEIKIQGLFIDVLKSQPKKISDLNGSTKTTTTTTSIESNSTKKKKRVPVNKLNDLDASQWIPETISVFVQKGLGAGHEEAKIERQHPAPFSFQDVGRLVKFFTKKGQKILDPFLGVGSTLKACAVNEREGVGIELVKKYVDLSRERLKKEVCENLFGVMPQKVIHGDALKEIEKFNNDEFDFIVTSPPYWNILTKKADHKTKQERIANNLDTKYSTLKNDLGNIEIYEDFINVLADFFNKCSRILKHDKYMAIIVSDFRNKQRYHMFHADLATKLEEKDFVLKGITILYQKHKKIFPYGYPYSYVPNIHHQYILILQNKKNENSRDK